MNIKRKVASIAACCALALTLPGVSSAASVIFDDSIGGGYQYRVTTYNNGAKVNGALRSKGGNVYYQGRVQSFSTPWCSGTNWSRYTSSTSSTTNVARGGTITALAWTCSGPRIQSRTARDLRLRPDPVGPSRIY